NNYRIRREDITLQYKNKNNLYKIIFLLIVLSFILSLTGCDWLSGGIFNIFDPKAQIITEYNPEEGGEPDEGCCNAGVSCINGVEFFVTGFAYNYHGIDSVDGKIEISALSRVVEASFYVAPTTTPGTPGPKTIIENIPLFFQDVVDYLYLHPFITEITCDLSLVGVDGAGHSLSFQVASELPVFEPGIDIYPPNAEISVTPGITGTAPFNVVFDASDSDDVGSGIADINWDFGDESTGTDITENHTYATPGSYSVTLTVTDFYGNKGYDTVVITVNEAEAPTAIINVTPGNTGIAPFKVYFDAYESHADPACGFGCEIVSYEWDFGDGDTGTGVTLNHTYPNVGTYTVILTVTDSNGKKGYANVEVTVTKKPTAIINVTPGESGVAPFIVYFDAYGSESESGIVSYEWEFGDGDTGDGITVSHTYDTVGTYIVYLTITDSNEYEAYDSVSINVTEGGSESDAEVIVTAEPSTIEPGETSIITATCTDDSGNTVTNGTPVAFGAIGGGDLNIISNITTNGVATATLTINNAGEVTVLASTIYASGSVTVTCAE
ncbi:MAG TPA: PKD domain-containing protein, partial [Candidatus Atribacteria bacterium]|nr:PKD domain-containing protein [Candidatus Atribacteria bacterium]